MFRKALSLFFRLPCLIFAKRLRRYALKERMAIIFIGVRLNLFLIIRKGFVYKYSNDVPTFKGLLMA